MTTYTQLWARVAALSIATVGVCKCKFLILAETFSLQKGSKFPEGLSRPETTLTLPARIFFLVGTGAAASPAKSGKSLSSVFKPCIWRRVEISGSHRRTRRLRVAGRFYNPALDEVELSAHPSGPLG